MLRLKKPPTNSLFHGKWRITNVHAILEYGSKYFVSLSSTIANMQNCSVYINFSVHFRIMAILESYFMKVADIIISQCAFHVRTRCNICVPCVCLLLFLFYFVFILFFCLPNLISPSTLVCCTPNPTCCMTSDTHKWRPLSSSDHKRVPSQPEAVQYSQMEDDDSRPL